MKKQTLKSMVPIHAPNLNELFGNSRDADKAKVILQYLFHVRQIMKDNENFAPGIDRESRWCPITAKNLKQMVRDYHRILAVLVDAGIVEVKMNDAGTKSYYPGKYSCLYRTKFPVEYFTNDVPRYRQEQITTPGVIRAVSRYYARSYDRQKITLLNSTRWFKPCVDFLDSLYLDVDDQKIDACGFANPQLRKLQADNFNNAIGRFIARDEYGHRIHSHLSVLPKDLRPFLKQRNTDERLVILDLKNSQPFMLASVFRCPQLIELIPEFAPVYKKIRAYSDTDGVKLFYNDCVQGCLYDSFMQITGQDKTALKESLFGHVFYAAPFAHEDDEANWKARHNTRQLFSSRYRHVLKLLDELKKTRRADLPLVHELTKKVNKKGKVFGKMYATPNMLAQRFETALLLDRITRCAVEMGIPTITIHDAWIMRESDEAKFRAVFLGVFDRLGIAPPCLDRCVLECAIIL